MSVTTRIRIALFCLLAILVMGHSLAGEAVQATVLSDSGDRIVLQYTFGQYRSEIVDIKGQEYLEISFPSEPRWMEKGTPALPYVNRSIIIPDNARMEVQVLSADYYETEAAIVPSKGNLYRTVDPGDVPYVFGEAYGIDALFPGRVAELGRPYIMRDHRGITVQINPFQYNPVTGLMRVYTEITVAVETAGPGELNVLGRHGRATRPSVAFEDIYLTHFLNFAQSSRYAPINEIGDMLIISHDAWMPNMAPFVTHKNSIGMSTTIVGVTAIGNTHTAIKSYIQGVYDGGNLAFVLLVGDYAEIDSPIVSGGASDPSYSKLAGADDYPEIVVGRFSAQTAAEVDTQVERTVEYETLPANEQDWFWKGTGIASDEGAGIGDEGQSDIEHQNEIRGWLLGADYTEIDQIYDPGATSGQVTTALNDGRGVVNYVGHGSSSSWSSTGFSSSDINNLTNDNMLPFIMSVACVNGQFHTNNSCFAETWLRATNGAEPTGAIAIYASSINQSWAPPMEGQDEFNLLLADPLQPYFSYGALCFAGSSSMMDDYAADGVEMFNTWNLFGDPSLRLIGRACTDAGLVNLDRGTYACEDIVGISVIDCNMNSDDQVVETVDVSVDSTSESGVESATLVEKQLSSPISEGSIALSETDATGVLMVSEGDTITVTYIDADDGEGGTDVTVTAEASVDCSSPMISNVQVTDIEPRTATVTFDTDEPTQGAVDFGTSCGELTSSANSSGLATNVAVGLSGMQENSTYYFIVHATDEAGNAATDDNGGACYSFTTPDIPDFFSEQFESDNDLDFMRLTFQPNGSVDFYGGCQDPIIAFPTDPAGGTEVTLTDDGNALVTLTGATVSLYGVSYDSFYIGANGYITFTAGDGDYTETLADHFDLPRISALFDDLSPQNGTVSWKQLADRAVVTWEGVPQYSGSDSNDFQIEMLFSGVIAINFLDIAASDGIAGLSEGAGLSPDFYESDLSGMVSCGGAPCLDGVLGEGEERIDCGGPCPACDCLSDGECEDALFCTGAESCNEYGVCVTTGDPCTGGLLCKESDSSCVDCLTDTHCDDGLFCNGVERCYYDNVCHEGPVPCPWTTCNDSSDVCIVCDNDGSCEPGENCDNCPNDCFKETDAECGNGICEVVDGESCISCPDDCNGRQDGLISVQFCCSDGTVGNNPITCADARCNDFGYSCTTASNLVSCCGDATCEAAETQSNCPADCTAMVPGEAGGGAWLMVTDFDRTAGTMSISYGVPCAAADHTIQYGELSRANLEAYSWSGQECALGMSGLYDWATGGTPDAIFFVVVANNGLEEGSFGQCSYGFERPEDAASGSCPMPQNLQYTCD